MPAKILLPILRRTLLPLIRLLYQAGLNRRELVQLTEELFDEVETAGGANANLTVGSESVAAGVTRIHASTGRNTEALGASRTTFDPALSVVPETVVIYGWHEDPDFVDNQGKPLDLPFDTGNKTFCDLVKRYAPALDPLQVRHSLEECNAISNTKDGKLNLTTRTLVAQPGPDRLHRAVSRPLRALLLNLENNNPADTSDYDPANGWPEGIVAVSNVKPEHMPMLRAHIRSNIVEFCSRLDSEMHTIAGDETGNNGETHNVGLGFYYFES